MKCSLGLTFPCFRPVGSQDGWVFIPLACSSIALQAAVDHWAPTLGLDLSPAKLGVNKPIGRPRDHWRSICLAFSRVSTFLAIKVYAFPLQGSDNPCLCLWGDRTL